MNSAVTTLPDSLEPGKIPAHVAIIMDGNGRWAQQRGLPRQQGHMAGVKSVRKITEAACRIGIRYLTLYAFSTENWGRPKEEVSALMALLVSCLHDEMPLFMDNGIRLRVIGQSYSCQRCVLHWMRHWKRRPAIRGWIWCWRLATVPDGSWWRR